MRHDELEFLRELETIDVDTGEIKTSSAPVVLRSIAIGSCIAVVVYDPVLKMGGIAHTMLPGRSPNAENKTKYSKDAIDILLDTIGKLGAKISDLEVNVVGGANVLQEGDIPDRVTESVLGHLESLGLQLKARRLGGIQRRSVFLDTISGRVFYTEGDGAAREL